MQLRNYFYLFCVSFLIVVCFSCEKNNLTREFGGEFLAKPGPILFISDKSGTSQLYSMNENGGNVKQLTDDPNFPITNAKWSPDGSKIVLISPVGGIPLYGGAVYIVDADGSDKYLLTKPSITVNDDTLGNITYQGAINPVWSPDNRKIAYSRVMVPEVYANRDIFTINIDGSGEKRITKTPNYTETCTSWSKDGNLLLIYKIDWFARDSSGKGVQHIFLSVRNLIIGKTKTYGKKGEAWLYPIWINTNEIIFKLIDNKGRSYFNKLNIIENSIIRIYKDNYSTSQIIGFNFSKNSILFNGAVKNSLNKILKISTGGTNFEDITPFTAEFVKATSWKESG